MAHGVQVKDLARRYNVNPATIYRVLSDAVQGVERGDRLTRKQLQA
ncbi:helix-turn-helix domain-containing protein [Gluconobacter cerevisiae]